MGNGERPLSTLNLFVATVALSGTGLAAYFLSTRPFESDPAGILVGLVVLGLVSEFFPVRFPFGSRAIEISLSTTFGLIMVFEYGIATALVLQGGIWAFGDIRLRKELRKMIYNVGQLWVSFTVGNSLGEVIWGRPFGDPPDAYNARYIVGAVAVVLGFLAVNNGLNVVVRYLAGAGSIKELATNSSKGETIFDLATALISILAVALLDESWALALLLLFPFGGMYRALLVLDENAQLARQREAAIAQTLENEARYAHERELMQERIARTQRLQAVGELAGGVAHDFNNLLAVVRNYACIARESVSEPSVHRDLDEVIKAADKGAGLVRQLLTFSRQGAQQAQVIDINETIADMTGIMRGALTSSIELQIDLSPDVPPVEADAGQIEQVVMNLVVNARDAMGGAGRLRVSTGSTVLSGGDEGLGLTPGLYVELCFADTGHGIAPELRNRIFEPFFSTKERGSGTGLGLATVYGIVKQAGGDVVVESVVGEGTTFTVRLPAHGGDFTSSERSSSGAGSARQPEGYA